ncbi:MAG: outer membrane lipoprotein-sorting protein [Kiritimatiellae bacterium]|nr:outer membrane lipoprotein-sorting protein [Kiritimatiellia bacterium]
MNFRLRLVGLVFALTVSGPGPLRAEEALPEAAGLLQAVRQAVPDAPLRLTGQLQSKSPDGEIEQTWNMETSLSLGESPPRAEYTIRDAFGADLHRFVVTWPEQGTPRFDYFAGPQLEPAPLPDLYAPIPGMDFSWTDLSLSFLWWPGGRTAGKDTRRGRPCYVIDLPAPALSPAGPTPSGAEIRHDHTFTCVITSPAPVCAGMRLWIDSDVQVLLQADAYDADNRLVRRLQVKSFKKVNDLWTILDLEIQSFPSRHKTLLRVRDVVEEKATVNAQR